MIELGLKLGWAKDPYIALTNELIEIWTFGELKLHLSD